MTCLLVGFLVLTLSFRLMVYVWYTFQKVMIRWLNFRMWRSILQCNLLNNRIEKVWLNQNSGHPDPNSGLKARGKGRGGFDPKRRDLSQGAGLRGKGRTSRQGTGLRSSQGGGLDYILQDSLMNYSILECNSSVLGHNDSIMGCNDSN